MYLVGFQPLPLSRLLNNRSYWDEAYAKYFLKHLIGRKKFMVTIVRSLPFRAKSHFWIWLRVNSCMANGTKLPFQVQPARSPLILTSTKTSDSAYFCRGKKMEENCSLRLQPFTFSHEIIQSSFIHQNNVHHFQATTMIELLLFHFYPFLMISNFEFGPHSARKYRTGDWLLASSLMHCT